MISSIISRIVILVFGTLYPAYASYKAVRTKNVREYVKWMMYWIVFALFTCTETFTDIFLSWFPFYYEIKIILVIWLLSPATKGSSILYRKFVHPMLSSKEQEIDEYISKAKEQSYRQVLDLGQKGVTVLMQTAIKGGGGIVNQLRKSYSLSDLSDPNNGADEVDDVLMTDSRLVRRRKKDRSPHRSSSASSASVYFQEVDVTTMPVIPADRVSEVRSAEDISSGYSSGEGLYGSQHPLKLHARESIASQRTNSLTRSRSTRVTRSNIPKKSTATSDDSDENEIFDTNIVFTKDTAKKPPCKPDSSSSETEFFDILPENNDFHLHGKASKIIPIRNDLVHLPIMSYNSKSITACNSSSSAFSLNLTKLSEALSSLLFPSSSSSVQIEELDHFDRSSKGTVDANKLNIENLDASKYTLDKTDRKLDDLTAITELDRVKNSEGGNKLNKDNLDASKYTDDESNRKLDDLSQKSDKKLDDLKREFLEGSKHLQLSRGGKYNKKQAPKPPESKNKDLDASAIKARLVLQPGVVRSISNSSENLNKEIFLNYSPKMRRKSRNHSPASSRSSKSSDSGKLENALNKMLKLPKKMTHLNIPGKIKEKRHSWSEFFHGKKLSDTKKQSLSASNLEVVPEDGVLKSKSGSVSSVRSLTDSPVAHRRLKIIRRYVDRDID